MREAGAKAIIWWLLVGFATLFCTGAGWWAQDINQKVSITSDKVIVLQTKFSYIEDSLGRIERKLGTSP